MWRWVSFAVAGVVALVVVVLVDFGASGVEGVAAQFEAPADATAQESIVNPERVICLGADPCPSLFRSWSLPRRLERSDLEILATASGWSVELEGDCLPRPNSFGRLPVCSATGEIDGYSVRLAQLAGSGSNTSVLTLSVRPLG
jgi:hypothetical protein